MARLRTLGAETGHVHSDTGSSFQTASGFGNGSIESSIARGGTKSFKFDATASNGDVYVLRNYTAAVDRRVWATIWFRVPALPSANAVILRHGVIATALCSARLTTAGKIQLLDQAGTQIGSDSAETVAIDTWHRLDLGVEIGTGATDYAECRLNGVSVASTTTGALSESAPSRVSFGWLDAPGANKLLYVDDVIVNDELGSVNNTWAADEKVVLLLPTADSVPGLWTGGAGGVTNLFEAVNNVPPAGVDNAAATDTSQIENGSLVVPSSYDATMQTYAAAGVGASDIVTAVVPIIEGANDSTTGTDTVEMSVVSNPAIGVASASVDANDGTFPTGWILGSGLAAEHPSVALDTAPVMRVTKTVSSTRFNTVCLMGMLVSYIPASSRSLPPIRRFPVHLRR